MSDYEEEAKAIWSNINERARSLGSNAVLHVTADELDVIRYWTQSRGFQSDAYGVGRGPARFLGHPICVIPKLPVKN